MSINRESDSLFNSFNVNFGYSSYVFFYDTEIMGMATVLVDRHIPKFREFTNFEGKVIRKQIFPDFFKVNTTKDHNNVINVNICCPKGKVLYMFVFDPKNNYVDLYRHNSVYLNEIDRVVQLDAVHKRTLQY